MQKRKQSAPKRGLSSAVPVIFRHRKVQKTLPRMSHSSQHSKFFFDMFMSLDTNVVVEYIIPLLPSISTDEGQNLLVSITKASDEGGAGLFQRDLLWDLWVPMYRESPTRFSIPFKNIVSMTATNSGVHGLARSVQSGVITKALLAIGGEDRKVSIDVSIGQCIMCSMPCKGGVEVDKGCYHTKLNPGKWPCLLVAQVVSTFIKENPIPIGLLEVCGMDLETPRGVSILETITDAMKHRWGNQRDRPYGPHSLFLTKFSMKDVRVRVMCDFVRQCMGDCEKVHLGECTLLAGNMGPVLCTPEAVFDAIQKGDKGMGPCKVRSLSISNPCIPMTPNGVDSMVMSLLRMPSLRDLSIIPGSWGHEDTTPILFSSMKRCMTVNAPMRFHELKCLSVCLVDEFLHSRITTRVGANGIQYIAMNIDDLRKVDMCAISFCRLSRLEIYCGDSPICALKLMEFLKSLKAHKDQEDPAGGPLDIIEAWCKFAPEDIARKNSPFMEGFKNVTRELRVHFTKSYIPGIPVGE